MKNKGMSKFTVGAIAVGGVMLLGLIISPLFIENVDAGYAGVVYNRNGGLEQKTLGQGWNFVSPTKRVTSYPIATETVNYDEVKVGTSDGKPITTGFSYNYHIDIEKLPAIFNKFRGQSANTMEAGFLKQRLTEAAKNVTTKYSVLEVMGEKSQEISLAIQKEFTEDVGSVGFVIESVTFTPPVPDDQTAAAIQAKVDAQQKLEQQKVELERAKITADQQRVESQGRADAALIEAQGQAKANEILRQSLTPELVQKAWIDKWNGQMPTVSGESTPVVQLPSTVTAK